MNIAEVFRTGLPSWSPFLIYKAVAASAPQFISPTSFERIQERDCARAILEDIQHLKPDWDGYGSLPVSKEAIAHARGFLGILEAQTPTLADPEITPTPSGTIALEWEADSGEAYLEIGKTRFSFFARSVSGSETRRDGLAEEIDGSLPELVEHILFPRWTDTYLVPTWDVSWRFFASDYVAPITTALTYMPIASTPIDQFSVPGITWWFHEGACSDPISYRSLEDTLAIYSETTPTVSQIQLAA